MKAEMSTATLTATQQLLIARKINFHAILGNSVGATMKLKGEVLILVDSALTHNFIAETIVGELDFLVQTIPSFGVQIGNGDIIHCNKVC